METALGLPVAAFVARRWVTREGFADAGLWPNIRRSWPYYLFAWLWPSLAYTAVAVAMLFGYSVRKDPAGVIVPALLSALPMVPAL